MFTENYCNAHSTIWQGGTARLKRDDTRTETRFGLSAKRTNPFKSSGSGGGGGQLSRLLAAEQGQRAAIVLSLASTLITARKCRYKAGIGG